MEKLNEEYEEEKEWDEVRKQKKAIFTLSPQPHC
jgi:hypothetical protein